jgi:hypothetical protein
MTAILPEAALDEPLRMVKVAEVRGAGAPRVHPVGRFRRRPYEHTVPATASCHKRAHAAPAIGCSCGFHAVVSIDGLSEVVDLLADSVVLDVEVAGTVIEHERGVRAQQQSILGIGFPRTCAWCGGGAIAVAPGRVWRSICGDCAGRRRSVSRAEATAVIGVDVAFVDIPAESRRRRVLGVLRSVGMCVLMAVCIIAGRDGGVAPAAMSGVFAVAAVAAVLCALTALARSSRAHTAWFVAQCACLCAASALLIIGAR